MRRIVAEFARNVVQTIRQRAAGSIIVGFNKMPGLDVYYAADGCFEDKAQTLRNPIYRRWGRYKHFADYERAVFAPDSRTEILMISEVQQPLATVVIGGVLSSTLLTLLILPVLYEWLEQEK